MLEILEEFSLKSTWFIPADIVAAHPDVVEKILDRGHEIGHHGLDHTGEYGATFEEQRERIEHCQEIFLKYTGRRAVGFGPRRCFPETERWIYSEGGFVYSSAGISGEACGWYEVEGEPTHAVNIPCRDEQMDDYVQTVFHSYPAVLVGGCPASLPTRTRTPTGSARWRAWCAWAIPVLRRFTRRLRGLRGGRWYFAASASIWPPTGMCGARPA